MKRCPQCNRTYNDETLNFCLEDGASLVSGAATEGSTVVLSPDQLSNAPTLYRSDRASVGTSAQPTSREKAARPPVRKLIWLIVPVVLLLAAFLVYKYLPESGKKSIDSIAVLPFTNVNNDPDMEYLSEGIADNIADSLSQVPSLRVVPLSKVSRYKNRDVDPQEVGSELGVRSVLIGKVMQRGDSLSIRVELVDVAQVSRLWGEQYNRKLSDILAVQEEIAREISETLRVQLNGDAKKRLTKRYTESTKAYQLYLQGR
jgi:TolB-like protein